MTNTIDGEIRAYGVSQVLVFLKDAPRAPSKASASLAAAIPVVKSRSTGGGDQTLIMELGNCFHTSEASPDAALAVAAKKDKRVAAGLNWYRRAKSAASETPAVRYFPNLGLMLGTVDSAGVEALRSHPRVSEVLASPILSLIRPVAINPAKPKAQYTWGVKRLGADQLHKQGLTGRGIIVGHLDTGADGRHPALKSAFHSFAEFDPLGFQMTPSPAPHDTDDHGTHTAGTIAGRTVGAIAVGVAPDAQLASAIVIEGGNVLARILGGMEWVIGQGARILSMSLGIRGFTEAYLRLTQVLRSRGILPVFAVGNEGPGTSRSPGNYSEALSVGAMNSNGKVANFSGSQRFARAADPVVPDLVAPGVDVESAKPGGGYQTMSGSSMATPHVAGLAALLMQAQPAATIDQVEKAIIDSCAPLEGELADRQGHGVPDAIKALSFLP